MSVDAARFKKLLSQFPAGATIVTYKDGDHYGGLTISSFCSVSLNPPLVLICVDRRAYSHDRIRDAGAYAVNVCAAGMEPLARKFASHDVHKPDLIASLPHTISELGAPLLDDAVARLDCKIVDAHPGGDHTVFIAEVEGGDCHDDVDVLVFNRGGYGSFHHDPEK